MITAALIVLAGLALLLRMGVAADILELRRTRGSLERLDDLGVNVLDFGAVGDGVADDTKAFQNAVNTGKNVYIPYGVICKISTVITATQDYQRFHGGGSVIAAVGADTVLSAIGKTGIVIDGVRITCLLANGSKGISLVSCTGCIVRNCIISGHAYAAVFFSGCNYCSVMHNEYLAASNDSRWGAPIAADISLENSNSHCRIVGNNCRAYGGYGIQIRSNNNGDHNDFHHICENTVVGYNSYGIMLYRNQAATGNGQTVFGCIVSDNHVSDISGNRPADYAVPGTLEFGAGIYVQGAENTVVSGNKIKNTNTSTNTETLAPGAIGVSNCGVTLIIGNDIENAAWYGVYLNDSNAYGAAIGSVVVSDNSINSSTKAAIKTVKQGLVRIIGNAIDTCTYGVFHFAGSIPAVVADYHVLGNTVKNCSVTGMSIDRINRLHVGENNIDTCATHGVSISNSQDVKVSGNIISNITTRGLDLAATNSGAIQVGSNVFKTCGVGVLINAPAQFHESNLLDACTTPVTGTYCPLSALDGSATPDVKFRRFVVSSPGGPLTITDFLNGVIGQVITIQATNANTTIQNNASVLLSGGANFAMGSNTTLSLLKTAGAWVEIGRKA